MLLYHLLVRRLLDEYAAYGEAKAQRDIANAAPDRLDPYRIKTVSYLAKLYQDHLERTIEDVSLLERKYAYVNPDAYKPLDPAQQFEGLWIQGSVPSDTDVTRLKVKVDEMSAALGTSLGQAPSSANRFPGDGERGDLWVRIKEGPLLAQFRKSHRIKFQTVAAGEPIDEKARIPQVPVIGSDRFYDIRLSHVQPRIVGASTEHGQLFVEMRMASFSAIYGKKQRYDFSYHAIHGEDQHPRYASLNHAIDTKIVKDAKCVNRCHACRSTPGVEAVRSEFCGDGADLSGDRGNMKDEYLDAVGVFSTWDLCGPEDGGGRQHQLRVRRRERERDRASTFAAGAGSGAERKTIMDKFMAAAGGDSPSTD